MKITKKDIGKSIAEELDISHKKGSEIFESLLSIIKDNLKSKVIKINKFGTFKYKNTKKRIGRNPKTKESYEIKSFKKLTFSPHNQLKNKLN